MKTTKPKGQPTMRIASEDRADRSIEKNSTPTTHTAQEETSFGASNRAKLQKMQGLSTAFPSKKPAETSKSSWLALQAQAPVDIASNIDRKASTGTSAPGAIELHKYSRELMKTMKSDPTLQLNARVGNYPELKTALRELREALLEKAQESAGDSPLPPCRLSIRPRSRIVDIKENSPEEGSPSQLQITAELLGQLGRAVGPSLYELDKVQSFVPGIIETLSEAHQSDLAIAEPAKKLAQALYDTAQKNKTRIEEAEAARTISPKKNQGWFGGLLNFLWSGNT